MKVIVAGAGDIGKFTAVTSAFPDIWRGRVLDVGCRSGNLARVLEPNRVEYVGLDFSPPANVIANVEHGLPFDSASFDVVVALDVLEHLERIHSAFHELCRVARRHVVISLPNIYEVLMRLRFLVGSGVSGKFGLPAEPPRDRHRWFFSLDEARAFCNAWAIRSDAEVVADACMVGQRRLLLGGRRAVSTFPNLLAPTYIAVIAKAGWTSGAKDS